LKFYGLPAQSLRERIVTVTGDLTQDRFGLTEEEYLQLAGTVDLVFHCAASVNYSYPYNLIKPHTIGGTTEVIRFACHTKTKTVQYVSSNGIFPGGDDAPYLENNDIDDFADRMEGGYNQAKWVAERQMWYASLRGLPICMFRPGNIGHHSVTGVVNPNDFQTLIIKACLRIGSAPIAPDWLFEMTPVDFLATAITKISDDPSHFGKVYNMVQQDPVPADLVFTRMQANGDVAELVPLADWKSRLQETADNADDLELKLLAQSLDSVEGYLTDTSVYDISQFSEAMSQSQLKPPVVDVDYVTMFLRSL
jgi:thioester reductase-like protein